MSAPMKNNMMPKSSLETLILSSYIYVLLLFSPPSTTSSMIPFILPDDVARITTESCILGLASNIHTSSDTDSDTDSSDSQSTIDELSNILYKVKIIFQNEPGVFIGKIDPSTFLWSGGKPLQWKKSNEAAHVLLKDLFFIPKQNIDRTCLLKTQYHKQNPEVEYFTGPRTVETITNFLNNRCNTFRLVNGELSSPGLHKQEILKNVFHVKHVSDMTMSKLYTTLNNPLNQSYIYSTDAKCLNNFFDQSEIDCKRVENKGPYSEECDRPTYMDTCDTLTQIPSQNDFFNTYLKRSKPVIFKGAIKDWVILSKWTNDFLRSEFGENEVHIKLTPGGDYEGVEKAEIWENYKSFKIPAEVKKNIPYPDLVVVRPATMNLKFSDFLDIVETVAEQKRSERNLSAYLEYSSIPHYMPALESDIGHFDFINGLLTRRHLNLWLSDGHTLGRLHFDPFDNLLCQVKSH